MVPQEVHESTSSSFFEMRSTTCSEYAQFLENKLYELNNLCNETKGTFLWRTYVWRNTPFLKNLVAEIVNSRKFMSVKLKLFCAFLSSQMFPIL